MSITCVHERSMLLSRRCLCVVSSRTLLQCSIRLHKCNELKTQTSQNKFPFTLKEQISLRKYKLLNPFIELDVPQGWNERMSIKDESSHVTYGQNGFVGECVSRSCEKQLLMNSRDFAMSTYAISNRLADACRPDCQKSRDTDTTDLTAKHCSANNLSVSGGNTAQTLRVRTVESTLAVVPQSNRADKLQTSKCWNVQSSNTQRVSNIVNFDNNTLERKKMEESGDGFCLYFEKENEAKEPLADPSWMKATPMQLSVVLFRLREELPVFFDYPHRLELYSKKLVVENGLMGPVVTTRGRLLYRLQIYVFRFCASIRFADPAMEVLKITKESKQSSIHVRWRVKGMPLIRLIGVKAQERMWDGFSIFEVGSDGLIREHKITRVTPSRLKDKEKTGFMALLMGLFQLGRKREFC